MPEIKKKEKPILFSGEMVRAILDGRKTMTRRVVKPQPDNIRQSVFTKSGYETNHGYAIKCPYGHAGDRLWVRETFSVIEEGGEQKVIYRADYPELTSSDLEDTGYSVWKPSIFAPRCCSRITLGITNINVERLQSITEEDAKREGVFCSKEKDDCSCHLSHLRFVCDYRTHTRSFVKLWDSINGKKYPWASNPWVWVIEFKRIKL